MIVGVGSDTAKEIRARVADLNDLLAIAAFEGITVDINISICRKHLMDNKEGAIKDYPNIYVLMTKEI